jgi:hypothetical protein
VLEKVTQIYGWLDSQIRRNANLTPCRVCGSCCDFDNFDHRLFVTGPELIYLAAKSAPDTVKQMTTARCPYNIEGKCGVYEHRFAGCRIFCCRGDADFQGRLSEAVLKKLKSICTELEIPYRYLDLATALNTFGHD